MKYFAGMMFAVGIVIVLGAMNSKAAPSSFPVGIKGDRLALVEQKATPYACSELFSGIRKRCRLFEPTYLRVRPAVRSA